MSVIPLTLFFSLLLAGTFVLLFVREQRRRQFGSAERDSLLPLADETPRAVGADTAHVPDDHDHDRGSEAGLAHRSLGEGGCGCRAGTRPPCAGCLQRRDEQEPAFF